MSTLIFGAGAIGQWFGTLLHRQGVPVTLYGRPTMREAVQAQGGISIGDLPPWEIPFLSEPVEIQGAEFDTVVVTVKTFAVEAALTEMASLGLRFRHLVAFQNGWGTEEAYRRRFPDHLLWVLTTTRAVGVEGPGRLRPSDRGGLAAAPWLHKGRSVDLPFSLRRVPLPLHFLHSGPELRWSKLLLNLIGNATGAIVGLPPNRLADHKDLMNCELKLIREALEVGRALGLTRRDLPGFPVRPLARAAELLPLPVIRPVIAKRLKTARGDKLPSLFYDLEQPATPSEIEHLNGAVVKEGRRLNVATPLQSALMELFEQCRSEPETWQRLRTKPQLLAEALHS